VNNFLSSEIEATFLMPLFTTASVQFHGGVFGWRPKLAMPKVSHAIVSSAAVWFTATAMARQTFLAHCPTCHRLIFMPSFATSVASILLATLSVAATVCRRLGVANSGTNQTDP